MECEQVAPEVKEALQQEYEQLNPKALLAEIRRRQNKLFELAVFTRQEATG